MLQFRGCMARFPTRQPRGVLSPLLPPTQAATACFKLHTGTKGTRAWELGPQWGERRQNNSVPVPDTQDASQHGIAYAGRLVLCLQDEEVSTDVMDVSRSKSSHT